MVFGNEYPVRIIIVLKHQTYNKCGITANEDKENRIDISGHVEKLVERQ